MKFLIAGLGNIGAEYAETRHNIGFMALDTLAASYNVAFKAARYGDIAELRHKGRIFVLLKPSSYMNLSGRPVSYWLQKEKVDPGHLLVIVDDLALPAGVLRLRAKGGAGGHNGLESIIDVLGTNMFARLRFGIGGDFPKGFQSQYVLSRWGQDEWPLIESSLATCRDMVISFGLQGVGRTMNIFNKRQKPL